MVPVTRHQHHHFISFHFVGSVLIENFTIFKINDNLHTFSPNPWYPLTDYVMGDFSTHAKCLDFFSMFIGENQF